MEQETLVRTYFVRVAADKQVVGLFVAPSLFMLGALVDECCDPNTCEYASAGMGGIMVEQPTTATLPLSDPANDERDRPHEFATGLEGGTLTQHWDDDLRFAPHRLVWKPLGSALPSIRRAVALDDADASEDHPEPDEAT
jgi:hypothetical protein